VPFDELAREIATEPDALAIVHLRKDAYALCVELDSLLKDTSTMHLSALMCADHRSALIREIKQRKQRGEAVRVVSTQLVEAGVDLDFRIVYRALGGLDAMAQAAGRCNREGLLNVPGELRVFIAATQPPLGVPRTALGVTQALLARWPELDLFASSSYVDFFSGLYGARDLDAKGVQPSRAKLDFKTTADLFKLIEDDWSAPLVVPYGGASQAVARLEHEGASRDTLRGLQRFTVNVPRFQLDQWLAYGFARMVEDTVAVLDGPYSTAYDLRFGLLPGRVGTANPSSLIIDD
jgi:CRISPR-associated endonuclease/helicase Cas3